MDELGPEVHGLVFGSDALHEHWERLDEFEGEGYERVPAPVALASGGSAVAFIYVLRGLSSTEPRVQGSSGDL